jgi:hypothetical protein
MVSFDTVVIPPIEKLVAEPQAPPDPLTEAQVIAKQRLYESKAWQVIIDGNVDTTSTADECWDRAVRARRERPDSDIGIVDPSGTRLADADAELMASRFAKQARNWKVERHNGGLTSVVYRGLMDGALKAFEQAAERNRGSTLVLFNGGGERLDQVCRPQFRTTINGPTNEIEVDSESYKKYLLDTSQDVEQDEPDRKDYAKPEVNGPLSGSLLYEAAAATWLPRAEAEGLKLAVHVEQEPPLHHSSGGIPLSVLPTYKDLLKYVSGCLWSGQGERRFRWKIVRDGYKVLATDLIEQDAIDRDVKPDNAQGSFGLSGLHGRQLYDSASSACILDGSSSLKVSIEQVRPERNPVVVDLREIPFYEDMLAYMKHSSKGCAVFRWKIVKDGYRIVATDVAEVGPSTNAAAERPRWPASPRERKERLPEAEDLGQRLERVATSVAYTKALLSHLKSEEKRLRKALRQQLRGSDYDKVVARLFGLVFRGTQ